MNRDAAALLQALLDTARPVTTRHLAQAAGIDESIADDVLAAMAVVGLVESAALGHWRPHGTLRDHRDHDLVVGLLDLLHGRLPLREISATPPPRLLTRAAAARELGVSVDSLTDWARRGLVPFTWTAGGHRRFNVEEIRDQLRRAA